LITLRGAFLKTVADQIAEG